MNTYLIRKILTIITMVPIIVFFMIVNGIVIWALNEPGSGSTVILNSWGFMGGPDLIFGYHKIECTHIGFLVLPCVALAFGISKVNQNFRVPLVKIATVASLAIAILRFVPILITFFKYFDGLTTTAPTIVIWFWSMLVTLFVVTMTGNSLVLLSTLLKDPEIEAPRQGF